MAWEFCVRTEKANLSNGIQTVLLPPHSIGQNKARGEGWGTRARPFARRSCKVFVIYHSRYIISTILLELPPLLGMLCDVTRFYGPGKDPCGTFLYL